MTELLNIAEMATCSGTCHCPNPGFTGCELASLLHWLGHLGAGALGEVLGDL